MLIPSHRHTAADLKLWAELEHADKVHGQSKQLAKKAYGAVMDIGRFVKAGPCYASVSWGKDSVVLADLVLRACRVYGITVPLVWVRVEPIANPDCAAVRDAFLSARPELEYHEIERRCSRDEDGWHATGTLESGFTEAAERFGTKRYISGVRADESGVRKISAKMRGTVRANNCAPLSWWTFTDIMGWLAYRQLPVHPVYAMLGGGRWPREQNRVASLGGKRGDNFGRAEWEREMYGDVLRRLERGQ